MDERALRKALQYLRSDGEDVRAEGLSRVQRLATEAAYVVTGLDDDADWNAAEQTAWFDARNQLLSRPDIVGALVAIATGPSVDLRAKAVLVLGPLNLPQARAVVLDRMLHDSSPHVRLMSAVGLPWVDEPAVVDEYVQALGDSFPRVARTACTALGQIGDRRAVPALRAALDYPSWDVRFHACEALYALGAMDQRIVQVLERLSVDPAAEEHDRFAAHMNEPQRDGEERTSKVYTTAELLALARTAMSS
jgi:HEAT repeat protein